MFDNKYPYTDYHELNLDWFMGEFKKLVEEWATVQADWTSLHDYVQNYFDNLNVQTEIDNKINAMILNGTFADIVSPFVTAALPALVAGQLPDVVAAQISSVVAAQISAVVADQLPAVAAAAAAQEVGTWLAAHIDPDTGYVIDKSLTVSDAAADAKVVGDNIDRIDNVIYLTPETINTFVQGNYSSENITEGITIRCAMRSVFCMPGDVIKLKNIDNGLKAAIGCYDNTNLIYDGGWQTSDFTMTVNSAGLYFVNIAKVNGTQPLSPSDIVSLTVEINQSNKIFDNYKMLYDGYIYDISARVSGNRKATDDGRKINSSAIRLTSRYYYHLNPGDFIKVSDIDDGILVAIGGIDAGAFIYDSGWLADDAIINVTTEGNYIFNISKVNQSQTISTGDVTTLKVIFGRNNELNSFDKFTVATWNIGHFSNGTSANTTINDSNYADKKIAFRSLINNLNADLLGLDEYSAIFANIAGTDPTAKDDLFNIYKYGYIGEQIRYSCNAVYSNMQMPVMTKMIYDCNQTAVITHTSAILATDYYYMLGYMYMKGKKITVIVTHCAFDLNNPDVETDQYDELITKYGNDDHVIIMGDFNATNSSEFDRFTSAGFKMANHGYIGDVSTFPTGTLSKALDNIIVKGLQMSNIRMITTGLSDHNVLACDLSIF